MKRRTFNTLPFFALGLGLTSCNLFQSRFHSGPKGRGIELITENNFNSLASPTQLNWMGHWLGEDKRETLVREVAQEFSFLHQNLNLNLKFWQDLNLAHKPGAAQLISNLIRAKKVDWDIIWLDDDIYPLVGEELDNPQWGEQHIVNFEEVAGFKETQKTFIIQDPLYRNQTGGFLSGPYIEGYYYALFYNKNVAERIGIKIKHQGMTFDDLLGYVEAVNLYNSKNKIQIAPFYESKDWTTLEIIFQSLVKSEISDLNLAKSEVGSPEKNAALFKTLQALETLGKLNPLIPSHRENNWTNTRHLILEDRTLFYVNGTWMYSHWHGIDAQKISKIIPVELPAFEKHNYYLGGYIPTWGVMRNSRNRDLAIELLMAWCTPKIAEKWVRYTKNPTGIIGNLSVAESGIDSFEQFQSDITARYGGNVHYSKYTGYLFGAKNRNLAKLLYQHIRSLLAGEITAKKAYQQILSKVQ